MTSVALIFLLIVVYDIYLWRYKGIEHTISQRLKRWSEIYLAIPMTSGVLTAHFVVPAMNSPEWGFTVLMILAVLVLIKGFIFHIYNKYVRTFVFGRWTILTTALLGFVLGALLWSQPDPHDLRLPQQNIIEEIRDDREE